jgi:hypothetical protein
VPQTIDVVDSMFASGDVEIDSNGNTYESTLSSLIFYIGTDTLASTSGSKGIDASGSSGGPS